MYRLIRDRYSMTKLVGLAQYNVAYVLKQQKKFDEAIAEYRQLIDSDVNDRDPGSHIMEAYRNYRHRAALDIASCQEAQGNFPEALRYLELARDKHRYQTWCVTCAGQSRESLAERIEACWMQLGRHTEVAESRLADLKGSGLRPSRVTSLIQLYRDASQLDDLTQMLDEIDEATLKDWKAKGYFKDQTPEQMRRQLPTWTARELLRIAELGERGDTAALIAIAEDISHYESDLSQPYTSNWRPRAAAEALARLGQRGFAAIKERYSSEQGGSAWLIYAVGHCNTPEAFQWLRTHGWKQTNWQTACHFTYALSLKGAAGRAVLEQMADEDDANLGRAAEKWLQHKPGPAGKPPAPRLVPGSLPRQSSAGTSNG